MEKHQNDTDSAFLEEMHCICTGMSEPVCVLVLRTKSISYCKSLKELKIQILNRPLGCF